jgi:hypothetical protein
LHSHNCGHCRHVYPAWNEFAEKYENDTGILIAECDCADDVETCDAVTTVNGYPTFFSIFGGRLVNVHPERDVEHFIEMVNDLKTLDPSIKCSRYFGQRADPPVIAISFPDEDEKACEKLRGIIEAVPKAEGRLHLAKRGNETSVIVVTSKDRMPGKWVVEDFEEIVPFVKDRLHKTIGNWSFTEIDEITTRQVGVFVQTEWMQAGRASYYSGHMADQLCMTMMTPEEFREWFPYVEIQEGDFPAFMVVNKERTKFKFIKGVDFHHDLNFLKEALNVTDEAEYDMPFRTPERAKATPGSEAAEIGEDQPEGAEGPAPIEEEPPVVAEEASSGAGYWIAGAILIAIGIVVAFKYRPKVLLRQLRKTVHKFTARATGKTGSFEA